MLQVKTRQDPDSGEFNKALISIAPLLLTGEEMRRAAQPETGDAIDSEVGALKIRIMAYCNSAKILKIRNLAYMSD